MVVEPSSRGYHGIDNKMHVKTVYNLYWENRNVCVPYPVTLCEHAPHAQQLGLHSHAVKYAMS